ncbi:MAG: electron transport complex subunit RsxB [Proteobacteria bacterium]|nr:electron transport complex subunit RsxB [Pseudomonadota bacterium]
MSPLVATVPALVGWVVASASGWLLGPALRARLDELPAHDPWRGWPSRVFAAGIAALPLAALASGAQVWLLWAAGCAGWLPGLLRRTPQATIAARGEDLIEAIDRLLPQTQCAQCGFPGCRPYATAIATGRADINRCPPGGEAGIHALATLLSRAPKPLDPAHGIAKAKVVARIVEADCIGCTKCIQACPVDAIIGAPKRMHTVIAELCTGCELCVPPCPVDCIELVPPPNAVQTNPPLPHGRHVGV